MAWLLLELQQEEIPARFLAKASQQLGDLIATLLEDRGAKISSRRSFYTLRRMAWLYRVSDALLPEVKQERRGPRVGAPQAAQEAFEASARAQGFKGMEVRQEAKGEFHYATRQIPAVKLGEFLRLNLGKVLADYVFPKSMRFGDDDFVWARPLRGVLIMCDNQTFKGELAIEGARGIALTDGAGAHPASGDSGFIKIGSAESYVDDLRAACVMVDQNERRASIQKVDAFDGQEALLDEVVGICEWPVCHRMELDKKWQDLPRELFVEVLSKQQRYLLFSQAGANSVAGYLVVLDHPSSSKKGSKAMALGNERVVRARLADADFFVHRDQQKGLSAMRDEMGKRVFFQGVTFAERSKRIEAFLKELLGDKDREVYSYLSNYFYADLASEMVGEFANLRGVMGAYLSKQKNDQIYLGLRQVYAARLEGGSATVAAFYLAERLERLVLLWQHGVRPSSRGDPHAMRRAALEIIMVSPRVPLTSAAVRVLLGDDEEQLREVSAFIFDRARAYFARLGFDVRLVSAVLVRRNTLEDLNMIDAELCLLRDFFAEDQGAKLLEVWKRAANMLRGLKSAAKFSAKILTSDKEKALYKVLQALDEKSDKKDDKKDQKKSDKLRGLAGLAGPLEGFMDDPDSRVLDCDDAKLRDNRIALLAGIRLRMLEVADFSVLVGAEDLN